MYVCGPTVYDYVHVGNLRSYVFADILRRYLKFAGYSVKEVMNFTDVEDKTIRQSRAKKKKLSEFTRVYEKAFLEDIEKLNIEKPEVLPRATEHVKEMIALVQNLLDKGVAYKAEDGIYFSISKFKNYGKLSKVKVDELRGGASKRVGKDEYDKEHANDFALWKFYTKEDGDVVWNTKFGKGRPGWHIECSAMSSKYLGKSFDIHTGGADLIFPHHENEIAQSEAASGKKFVKYWMHNEWVLVDGKKMSKSLKNFYKLSEVEKKGLSSLDLRYFYLTKSYRQQLNFTWKDLEASKNALSRLKNIISEISNDKKTNQKYLKEFESAMNDDLNTPKALQVLWKLVRDVGAVGKHNTIKKMDLVFGLDLLRKVKVDVSASVKKLVADREKARKEKDWKKADDLRAKINKAGFIINDTSEGPKLKRK